MSKSLLFMILLVSQCFAQAPPIQWEHTYGGTKTEGPSKIIHAHDGGYLVSLYSSSQDGDISNPLGNPDFWLVKLDNGGNLQWEKSYGGVGWDFDPTVTATPDGGYIMSGFRRDTNPASGSYLSDIEVIKLDSEGAVQWTKFFDHWWATDIKPTPDGGYIMAGYDFTLDHNAYDYDFMTDVWLFKLDANGNLEWQQMYGGTDRDEVRQVLIVDGGYMLGGTTKSIDRDVSGNHGDYDFWVLKVDNTGNILWQKTYGGSSHDTLQTMKATSDGGYVLIGDVNSHDGDVTSSNIHNPGGTDCWVVKTDVDGAIQWQHTYGGTYGAKGNDIIETADGGYILGGSTSSNDGDITEPQPTGATGAWVVKLSSSGAIVWQKLMGDNGYDYAYSMLETDDGYIMAGKYDQYLGLFHNTYTANLWIVKFGSDALSRSSFSGAATSVSPNPVNSVLNIQLPAGITVDQTIVTDVTGKKVATQDGDMRSISFDAIAAGVYFVTIYTAKGKDVHKVIKR